MSEAGNRRGSRSWDESDVRIRPNKKGSRPRTKTRPAYDDAVTGRVVTVDRGRYTTVVDEGTPDERTGMQTTALIVQVGARRVCLYYTGRRHAGENLEEVMKKRETELAAPIQMSDALGQSIAAGVVGAVFARWFLLDPDTSYLAGFGLAVLLGVTALWTVRRARV